MSKGLIGIVFSLSMFNSIVCLQRLIILEHFAAYVTRNLSSSHMNTFNMCLHMSTDLETFATQLTGKNLDPSIIISSRHIAVVIKSTTWRIKNIFINKFIPGRKIIDPAYYLALPSLTIVCISGLLLLYNMCMYPLYHMYRIVYRSGLMVCPYADASKFKNIFTNKQIRSFN